MITFKINGGSFACSYVGRENGVTIYRGYNVSTDKRYFVARRGKSCAYSATREKAVKNLSALQYALRLERYPLDLTRKMDIDTFVFIYRRAVVACADVKMNLQREIIGRNWTPADRYTLQQWICLARNRHNFEYFPIYLAQMTGADESEIQYHHDCSLCAKKCGTELDDRSR